jgi:hypothetical protein
MAASEARVVDGVAFDHDGVNAWISRNDSKVFVWVAPSRPTGYLVKVIGGSAFRPDVAMMLAPLIAAGGKLAEQLNKEARDGK